MPRRRTYGGRKRSMPVNSSNMAKAIVLQPMPQYGQGFLEDFQKGFQIPFDMVGNAAGALSKGLPLFMGLGKKRRRAVYARSGMNVIRV